ncbi:MAG TPA: VIT1/CCC1 transporter family protein [Myxococcaceae bacterium]|nr:VIT1/CCC1 transporter family protein [Myxococcaceae bacterium]
MREADGASGEADPSTDREYHEHVDPHGHRSRLVEVILGGQDGLVNVLGVILGMAAASGSQRLVIAAGLAATFAESISMAAVAFTTKRAEAELFQREAARERRHFHRVPELEREEVRAFYRRKGFQGPLLEKIVQTITADEEVWLAVMMAEEHRLEPVSVRRALGAALVVGLAALAGSLLPLAPFLVLGVTAASWASVALSAAALFVFGALKARWTVSRPWRGGAELAAIGIASAVAGYLVGAAFQVG